MITVHLTYTRTHPFTLHEVKLNPNLIELIEDLGTQDILRDGIIRGPMCIVRMSSGDVYYVNGTSTALEARST